MGNKNHMTNIKYTVKIFVFWVFVCGPETWGCHLKPEGFTQVWDIGQLGLDDIWFDVSVRFQGFSQGKVFVQSLKSI